MKEKIEFKNLTLNATKLKFQRHLVQIAPVRNWKEGGGVILESCRYLKNFNFIFTNVSNLNFHVPKHNLKSWKTEFNLFGKVKDLRPKCFNVSQRSI